MVKDKMVFPGPGFDSSRPNERGLTRREYFAIHLLSGRSTSGTPTQLPILVKFALDMADELIKQLDE